jgi:hypothetical protein
MTRVGWTLLLISEYRLSVTPKEILNISGAKPSKEANRVAEPAMDAQDAQTAAQTEKTSLQPSWNRVFGQSASVREQNTYYD